MIAGGGVPGATVTATETRTNITRTAVSNDAGNYSFNNLAPGVYRVDGELVGFKKFSREGVEVSVNTTVRVEIVLAVGQLEESVIVTGEAPMLQTDRTDTGRIIESTQITQMPLGFNRNFQALLITVPGASRPFRPHSEFYNSQESLSSNVNGQSRQVNNVQLEGADNSDNGGSLAFYIPSAEAIESVSVATSNYDAEFGRAGGAVTNVTIKSGTNTVRRLGLRLRQHRGDGVAQPVYDAGSGRLPSTCRRALRLAGRSSATSCSSSAISSARATTAAASRRATCRRPRSATAISVRRRRAFTIRRPAMPTAAAARSFRTIRFRPTASARSHGV